MSAAPEFSVHYPPTDPFVHILVTSVLPKPRSGAGPATTPAVTACLVLANLATTDAAATALAEQLPLSVLLGALPTVDDDMGWRFAAAGLLRHLATPAATAELFPARFEERVMPAIRLYEALSSSRTEHGDVQVMAGGVAGAATSSSSPTPSQSLTEPVQIAALALLRALLVQRTIDVLAAVPHILSAVLAPQTSTTTSEVPPAVRVESARLVAALIRAAALDGGKARPEPDADANAHTGQETDTDGLPGPPLAQTLLGAENEREAILAPLAFVIRSAAAAAAAAAASTTASPASADVPGAVDAAEAAGQNGPAAAAEAEAWLALNLYARLDVPAAGAVDGARRSGASTVAALLFPPPTTNASDTDTPTATDSNSDLAAALEKRLHLGVTLAYGEGKGEAALPQGGAASRARQQRDNAVVLALDLLRARDVSDGAKGRVRDMLERAGVRT